VFNLAYKKKIFFTYWLQLFKEFKKEILGLDSTSLITPYEIAKIFTERESNNNNDYVDPYQDVYANHLYFLDDQGNIHQNSDLFEMYD